MKSFLRRSGPSSTSLCLVLLSALSVGQAILASPAAQADSAAPGLKALPKMIQDPKVQASVRAYVHTQVFTKLPAAIKANNRKLNRSEPVPTNDQLEEMVDRLTDYLSFLAIDWKLKLTGNVDADLAFLQKANDPRFLSPLKAAAAQGAKPFYILVSQARKALKAGRQADLIALKTQILAAQIVANQATAPLQPYLDAGLLLDTVQRLLESSTEFLTCDSFSDASCLERKPGIPPLLGQRWDTRPDLGQAQAVVPPLQMDYYFTQYWDSTNPRSKAITSTLLANGNTRHIKGGMANALAYRMITDGNQGVDMALYGIDDTVGTMKPVFDALKSLKAKPDATVRAVVDIRADKTFQYKDTPALINLLTPPDVKVEFPATGDIMHNKFVVMKGLNSGLRVWSGTTNVSATCMGAERNANASFYIRNSEIAQAYEDEFQEMFGISAAKPSPTGLFHQAKTPNTHRYFVVNDPAKGKTEVRVHFSPTDDGEHRSIIPTILSIQRCDHVRISMFAGAGYETLRAFQYAQSKGAQIEVVMDRLTGVGATSWVRSAQGSFSDPNPYGQATGTCANGQPAGTLKVLESLWDGLDHTKIMTVSRPLADGHEHAVAMILGSQNWSTQGNDANDENMMTLTNTTTGVAMGDAFNQYFSGVHNDAHHYVRKGLFQVAGPIPTKDLSTLLSMDDGTQD